jgi:hypothetical protein
MQEGLEAVMPYLVRIFRFCLSIGYVPAILRQVKAVFIPKAGRNSYSGLRDCRPISLTSFLYKPWRGSWIVISETTHWP